MKLDRVKDALRNHELSQIQLNQTRDPEVVKKEEENRIYWDKIEKLKEKHIKPIIDEAARTLTGKKGGITSMSNWMDLTWDYERTSLTSYKQREIFGMVDIDGNIWIAGTSTSINEPDWEKKIQAGLEKEARETGFWHEHDDPPDRG